MKMFTKKFLLPFVGLVLVLGVVGNSVSIVPEMNMGVMTSKNKTEFLATGVHAHVPFARVHLIDLSQRVSVVSVNSQNMISNYSVLWSITSPQRFWNVTQDDGAKVEGLFADNIASLAQNTAVQNAGIQVNAVMLTGQNLSDANLKTTYQNMQGLANAIAQGIIADGNKNAQVLRSQGDATLVQIEGDAAAQAANVVAEGQIEAMQMNAPLYHKNPELFKLLVNSKAQFGN